MKSHGPNQGRFGRVRPQVNWLACILLVVFFLGCASKNVKPTSETEFSKIQEFEQAVRIQEVVTPVDSSGSKSSGVASTSTAKSQEEIGPRKGRKGRVASSPSSAVSKQRSAKSTDKSVSAGAGRLPLIEPQDGFDGRRPLVDPFRPGERVVHAVRYFLMEAGTLSLEVKPLVKVNDRLSYQFAYHIRSSPFYSRFYEVDDRVNVLMDFESLLPSVFTLHVRESGQSREARALFNHNTRAATYWERRITPQHGEEQIRKEWELEAYAQSLFSAAFYLRTFQWPEGRENSFYVSDAGENMIVRGKVIQREVLETKAGKFPAIKIKPEVELQGKFKPVGDLALWLSDDDRKFILRIEAKIRIGTLVSQVIELERGEDKP